MDSWKTDWDFLETIHRATSLRPLAPAENRADACSTLDYHRTLEILTFHTAEDEGRDGGGRAMTRQFDGAAEKRRS